MIRWIFLCLRQAWWGWRWREVHTQYCNEIDHNFESVNEAFDRLASVMASSGPSFDEVMDASNKFFAACEREGCETGSGPD